MLNSKLPNTGTTIFAVMSQMADEYNAINLSRGFPDFNCSEELIALVHKNMVAGNNQYAPIEGILELRTQISELVQKEYSCSYNPLSEITITSGATQAIYTAIATLIKEDDEVIIFEPAYDCYVPAIEIHGGKINYISLQSPNYKVDWDEVQKMITPQTRMIILNSPHNPTGTILSAYDMERLKKIVSGTNIIILSDEVYEHIIYDGYEHQSIARYPQLAERSIIVSSFGKSLHITGWRIGYCLAPEKIMREFRKIHQFSMYTVNAPMQYAIYEYLKNNPGFEGLSKFYQKKRDFFNQIISASKFTLKPVSGTYFQLLDYSAITDEKDTVFAERLVKEFGVASIPVSVFSHDKSDDKVLRFCFAKNEETLEKAAQRLLKL